MRCGGIETEGPRDLNGRPIERDRIEGGAQDASGFSPGFQPTRCPAR